VRPSHPASEAGPDEALADWRLQGLHRFDPVAFRLIEALARRTAGQTGGARRVLQGRLATLMAAYGQRQAQAQAAARERVERAIQCFPAAAAALRQGLADGDFEALHRHLAALEHPATDGLLAELVRHVDRQASVAESAGPGPARPADTAIGSADGSGGAPAELKAVRAFRSTWARLSVDQQLTRSLARIPEQAGPLNSQLLVLRSLKLMRDVSPAYLSRFMSYVDALLWLDEAGLPGAPAQAAAPRGDADKKRKPGRSRGGQATGRP
jgi:hypothetical protein